MRWHLPLEIDSGNEIPSEIQAYLSVRSQGGQSVFAMRTPARSAKGYHAKANDQRESQKTVESLGLKIVAESRLGLAVVGPAAAYEELTGGRVVACERLMNAGVGRQRYVTHLNIVDRTVKQPAAFGEGRIRSASTGIEGLVLLRPRLPHAIFPSPIPPAVSSFHLRLPNDVALGLGAKQAHKAGHRGAKVTVAMVDTGQYAHPFFPAHHYDVKAAVSVTSASSTKDPIGHGTGESANIFAVAPDATLRPIRASNAKGDLVGAVSGFLRAKDMKPDVLTNSWGGDYDLPAPALESEDKAWAMEIVDAIEQGIVVVFSGGNGQFSVEPQVPGVLAAGGAFISSTHELRASNYASGYRSPWFHNRVVPDVCGLVGLLPRGQYLMLPVAPGCELDRSEAAVEDSEPGDGTSASDGWALFSGTSAAAPQMAGVAALVLGAKRVPPAKVIEAITKTAVDVKSGRCHPRFNHEAKPGADLATGAGLANAGAAVEYALAHF